MPAASPPRVFISYSHDSPAHAESVLALADQLRRDGIDAWIDQYENAPSRGWARWTEDQVERADFVLCVCTETYRRRFDQKEDPGSGSGVTWEGALIRIALYLDRGENKKFLPALFAPDDAEHIPTPLKAFSFFQPLDPKGYDSLYRHLTGQPKAKAPPLGKKRSLQSQPRRSLFGKPLKDDAEPTSDEPLARYKTWAREHYDHLDLIGIDAGDVQVKLEEIYVRLRVAFRETLDVERLGMFRGGHGSAEEQQPIEVEEVLRASEPRHVLIFGEPGSGKTTALCKLHQLCWQSAVDLGLAEGTVPVFLRLRHLDRSLLDQGLAAFIEHEVHHLSGGRLSGLGETLWRHGRLLLLFDGLDEIADADYRAEVLRCIGWYLGNQEAAAMRAVVSCRRVGLPGGDADRDRQFRTYEVRPFQDDQIAQLVKQWFRELARRGKIDQATADRRVSTILEALGDRKKSSQQILEMASNPLLLTLLCVVVLLGNEIPKKRVRFYEQCLDVLLDRWPRQRGKEAPVELGAARDALGQLAFYLHAARRKDDLSWAEAVAELMALLGDGPEAAELFDWAHHDVGLLVDYTEEDFGFVHLGLQEHLTARHLIANPGDLEVLAGDFDESWWTEVFLQLSALSERAGFAALTSRLLQHTDALERRAGLLRDCLGETSAPDLTSFLQVLDEGDEARQLAVLQLLSGFAFRPPELLAALEKLAKGKSRELSEAAKGLLRRQSPDQVLADGVAVVAGSPADEELARQLAEQLRGWQGGWSAEVFVGLGRKTGTALKHYSAVIVLVGAKGGDWGTAASLRKIYSQKRWLVTKLPGEPRSAVPEAFSDCEELDWQLDDEDALIEAIVERLRRAATREEPKVVSRSRRKSRAFSLGAEGDDQKPYTEPVTGAVFLPVPGGSFMMGSDNPFRVRLSPFWLARTPVTNKQYSRFLEATRHQEPETWRDRRFSAPGQPVVSVSWDDAVAYCRWLTATNPDGHVFQLPSEAQWEYAARGTESRMYPWGEKPPNERLACYGLDLSEGKPTTVGSYPEGAGPFGHLDLAGLVWEWCRDAWERDPFRWSKGELFDPVGESDPDFRPLRGGAWWSDAEFLRSAVRGFEPGIRLVGIGFRVLCSPPSLDS